MVALLADPVARLQVRPRLLGTPTLGPLALLLCVLASALAPCAAPVLATPAVDAKDGIWVPLPPPAARAAAAVVLDPVRDRLLLFGGVTVDGAKNDVWQLSLSGTPAWSVLQVTGSAPSGRYLHTAIYDPLRDRVIAFGGAAGASETYCNEAWSLSLADTLTWTLLTPLGTPPVARGQHSAIYDPVHDRMLVYGGSSSSTTLGDLHALSLSGSPEWTQLDVPGAPPARGGHSAVYDPDGDRMLVFGGTDGANGLNDVWALDLGATPAWSPIPVAGTPPGPRFGAASAYDAATHRMILFGGVVSPNFPVALSDAWALSLSGGPAWNELTPAAPLPSPRYHCNAAFDSARRRLLVFGGLTPAAPTDLTNDLWALDLDPPEAWSELPGPSTPEPRALPCSAYDSRRQRMWVWGGGTENQLYPDVWSLALSGVPGWHKHAVPSGPSARWGASSIYDSDRDRIVVFGGSDGATRNDLWALSPDGTPQWSAIAAAGTAPPPRYGHSAVWDSVRSRMIVFGGMNDSWDLMNDVWELSLKDAPTWQQLTPLGASPPPRAMHAAIYDPQRNRMLVFGGYGESASGGETSLDDLWQLSLGETPEWTPLPATGAAPTARRAPTAILDPARDRMVVHGGYLGDGLYTDETWEFSLPSQQWRLLAPSGPPPSPARGWHTAICDSPRDRMVVFAGFNDYVALDMPLDDTWVLEWSATTTPVLISLVNADAGPGFVRLRWYAVGIQAAPSVERRTTDTAWRIIGVARSDSRDQWSFEDREVEPGRRYGYRLVSTEDGGTIASAEHWIDVPAAAAFALVGIAPNPTSSTLGLITMLPRAGEVRVELFDPAGRRVLSRKIEAAVAGRVRLETPLDARVKSGIYSLRVSTRGWSAVGRVVVAR